MYPIQCELFPPTIWFIALCVHVYEHLLHWIIIFLFTCLLLLSHSRWEIVVTVIYKKKIIFSRFPRCLTYGAQCIFLMKEDKKLREGGRKSMTFIQFSGEERILLISKKYWMSYLARPWFLLSLLTPYFISNLIWTGKLPVHHSSLVFHP